MIRIGVVVDSPDRRRFFNRFEGAVEVVRFSAHPKLVGSCDFGCLGLSELKVALDASFWSNFSAKQTLDYHLWNAAKARFCYLHGYLQASFYLRANRLDRCFIWNGAQAFSQGVAEACRQRGVELRFMEIGNVPGKLFVDPRGVNKNSTLFSGVSKLRKYSVSDSEKTKWLVAYRAHLARSSSPPQRKIDEKYSRFSIRNYLFNLVKNSMGRGRKNARLFCYEGDRSRWYQELPQKYIFIPLQVSNDTQLLLNSTVDNVGLLRYVLENPLYKREKIVVKFHPCENEIAANEVISFIENYDNVVVNQGATIELIEGSDKVVTINSTVGLEAKLLGKDVEFLGESIFAEMERSDAFSYVMRFLIDVDYFENRPFTETEINLLLSR